MSGMLPPRMADRIGREKNWLPSSKKEAKRPRMTSRAIKRKGKRLCCGG